MKTLEKLSSIAVICTALLFCIVLVKYHLLNSPDSSLPRIARPESPLKGKSIDLPGVKWDGTGATMILTLSTSCHFCHESIPFYKKLAAMKQAGKASFRLLAVFPEQVPVGESYMKQNGVLPDEVVSLELSDIGVEGTPTLLLVNSQGVVQNVWVGKLSEADEKEVLSQL